jgi:hypothetical protein
MARKEGRAIRELLWDMSDKVAEVNSERWFDSYGTSYNNNQLIRSLEEFEEFTARHENDFEGDDWEMQEWHDEEFHDAITNTYDYEDRADRTTYDETFEHGEQSDIGSSETDADLSL